MALGLWSSISLPVCVRGIWDHLDPGNSGVAHGMSSLSFGLCGFMLSEREAARCSAGCVGWCRRGAHWCQAPLCIAAVMFPLALPSPAEQALPKMSQHVGQLLSCLAAALLHGCLHGLAAGRSPPFMLSLRDLPTLLGTWGFSWESQADLHKLLVLPRPGGVQAGGSLPSPAVSLPGPSIFNGSSEVSFITG